MALNYSDLRKRLNATRYAMKRMADCAIQCPGDEEALKGWAGLFSTSLQARIKDGWTVAELTEQLGMPEA